MKNKIIFYYVLFILFTYSSQAQTICTIAGSGPTGPAACRYSGDGGPATNALLCLPTAIVLDPLGNIYFTQGSAPCVRKINPSGIITTIAGTGIGAYGGDGGPATAANFEELAGIGMDKIGNIYVSDEGNQRVRKIDTAGIVTTIAGNGSPGYSGDGSAATLAQLHAPYDLTLDSSGNIYIADYTNSCIRKVNKLGIICTVAGTGTAGYNGDGVPATQAQLNKIYALAVDKDNNIYICDAYNYRVRKVNAAGVITTIAGTGTNGYSGDGGAATLAEIGVLRGIALDNSGNIYLSEFNNMVIRKINSAGIITTIAGTGSLGFSGDGGPASAAQFYSLAGMAIAVDGDIYIGDGNNQRVREIHYTSASVNTVNYKEPEIAIMPNPSVNGKFTLFLSSDKTENIQIEVADIVGRKLMEITGLTNRDIPITLENNAGIYFVKVTSAYGQVCKKVVIGP